MSDERFTLVKKGNGWVVDDSSREKFYLTPNETVKLLNDKDKTIKELKEENDTLNEYIDTIFEGNTHICKELDIENARFHCPYFKDYKEPTCTYMECFDCDELIPVNRKIDETINGERLRYSMDKSVYELYDYDKPMKFEEVLDRLNNQDKTIRMLKEKNSKKMLGETKPFNCKDTTIYVDKHGNITSEARPR